MIGIGHWELLIILVIVLVVFGAGKLPQVGGALGKGIRNFKDSVKGEDEAAKTAEPSPEPSKLESKPQEPVPAETKDENKPVEK